MYFSSADIAQIFVTLISTIGAIIIAKTQKPPHDNNKGKALNIWIVGMYICIMISVVNTGLLAWRWTAIDETTGTVDETLVKITHPVDGSETDLHVIARGTSQGLPADQVIWIVIFPLEVGRYYPHGQHADMEASGNWSSFVYIGRNTDSGKVFDIIAAIADAESQAKFNAYQKEATDRNDWLGLETLPKGVTIYDRITVTRK